MRAVDFEKIVENRMRQCRETLTTKGEEYSRDGDRLWNFKRAGEKLRCSPAQALMGMKAKHDVSIDDMVSSLHERLPSREMLDEKINDSINYLLLLEGLVEELRGFVEAGNEPEEIEEWS